MRSLLALVAFIGLTAIAVADDKKADKADPPKKPEKPEPTLKVGDTAPSLKADAWLQGEPIKAFAPGNVYVVEFWATWCGPCIVMMPHMSEMQAAYKSKNVTFIGFTAKDPGNTRDKVEAFVTKRGPKLGYTFAYADDAETKDAWMKAAGQNGIPCSFVVAGRQDRSSAPVPGRGAAESLTAWGEAEVKQLEESPRKSMKCSRRSASRTPKRR